MTSSVSSPHITTQPMAGSAALSVANLTVALRGKRTLTPLITDVGLKVQRGATHGLVGESGSGKTMTSLAIMGVLPRSAKVVSGSVCLDGRDVLSLPDRALADVRGRQISMIFQDAMRSLNPAFTVGEQIAEVARRHLGLSRRSSWRRAVDMLDRVAIHQAERRAHDYPSEFSGGMAQRVMIAMALVAEPEVLIADEPTTALDVTVQAQVLLLLRSLQQEMGLAIVFITHDLGVVAEMCDEVSVMYAGQVVETAETTALFDRPQHPYTAALLASVPTIRHRTDRFAFIPGVVPAPNAWPSGCRFSPRCSFAVADVCCATEPQLTWRSDRHSTRCVRIAELELRGIEQR